MERPAAVLRKDHTAMRPMGMRACPPLPLAARASRAVGLVHPPPPSTRSRPPQTAAPRCARHGGPGRSFGPSAPQRAQNSTVRSSRCPAIRPCPSISAMGSVAIGDRGHASGRFSYGFFLLVFFFLVRSNEKWRASAALPLNSAVVLPPFCRCGPKTAAEAPHSNPPCSRHSAAFPPPFCRHSAAVLPLFFPR